MDAPLLQIQDVHVTFGGAPLLAGAGFIVGAGDRLCLVGRNGAGKSTLLQIAAGHLEPDGGRRTLAPGTTVRYLGQSPNFEGAATVGEYVEAGLAPGDDAHRSTYLLERLGFTGSETPALLSGGEARRVALARVLAPKPNILFLDEPTNHLDLSVIEWLEGELLAMNAALVLVSHDRRFLENLSNATIWLDRGETKRLDKSFAHFEGWRDEILKQGDLARQKLDRKIAEEMVWLRQGVTARRKRNQGRLARLEDLRQEKRDQRQATGQLQATVSHDEKSGSQIIKAKALNKSYDDRKIVADFSIRIMKGDRIGLVGPNGAGKTTLLRLLIGDLAPDAGTVDIGERVLVQVLDQRRAALDDNQTIWSFLTDGRGDTVWVNGEARHVAGYAGDFLFQSNQLRSPIKVLSGGEKARLLLAKALAEKSNLLVLDEPTNDLDLETLDLLQEFLANYPGTVLLVSHDRDFLDRVTTSILWTDGSGHFEEYAGGYSDMVRQKAGRSLDKVRTPSAEPRARRAPSKTPRSPRPQKKKLTYKDKHALETLPDEIANLEKEIAELEAKLGDPDLFAKDAETFERVTLRLAEAQKMLGAAEERWLELELKREELDAD